MKSKLALLVKLLSDKRLTVWMVMIWVLYYVSFTIWGKEAFAGFAGQLSRNPLFQGAYILFLVNLVLRLVRRLRDYRGFWLGRAGVGWSVVLLLLGFLLSSISRQQMQPLVGEGDVLGIPWSGELYPVTSLVASMNRSLLDMDDGTGIFRMEPRMILQTGEGERVVGAFPPARFGRTWMHILQCGLAPGLRIERSGRIVREGYAALRLLPPGNTDEFASEGTPYRFQFKLVPNEVIMKQEMQAGKYDLMNPVFQIRVMRQGEEVALGLSSDPIIFDGNTLTILPSTTWALLDIVRDDGVPVFAAGLLLLSLGICMEVGRFAVRGLRILFRQERA